MLRRSERILRALNYEILYSKGERIYKEIDNSNLDNGGQIILSQDKLQTIKIQVLALTDDINDFIEENDVNNMDPCLIDVDNAIHRMEGFRSTFREKTR